MLSGRTLLAGLFPLAVGCGDVGSRPPADGGARDVTSADATRHADGRSDGSRTDGGAPSCPVIDAGGSHHSASEVPENHRPAGSACPAQRAAVTPDASPCTPPDSGACGQCSDDSDCTAGPNGRCGDNGPVAYLGCSYDECFQDSDCDAGAPCECRTSSASSAPNLCLTGSNCRVDSDCGPGGYCSPSILDTFCSCPSTALCGDSGAACFAGSTPVPCACGDGCGHGYFCHTPCDTCVNDGDCGEGTCNYDVVNHLWDCSSCLAAP